MQTRHLVLVIDDDELLLRLATRSVGTAFALEGVELRCARILPPDDPKACALPISYRLNGETPMMVLIDWHLTRDDPELVTPPLIKRLRELYPDAPIYVFSGDSCPEDRLSARLAGANDWFIKGTSAELVRVIKAGIKEHAHLADDTNWPDHKTSQRKMIRRSWVRHGGDLSGVSADTGINKRTLYRILTEDPDLAL